MLPYNSCSGIFASKESKKKESNKHPDIESSVYLVINLFPLLIFSEVHIHKFKYSYTNTCNDGSCKSGIKQTSQRMWRRSYTLVPSSPFGGFVEKLFASYSNSYRRLFLFALILHHHSLKGEVFSDESLFQVGIVTCTPEFW